MDKPHAIASVLTITIILIILSTAQAADIELSDTCSLSDAIASANMDAAAGGCPAGNGPDTITITADIPLRAELPEVASVIIIEGEGYRISGIAEHRIFYVGPDGELFMNNLNLLDGRAQDCRWIDRYGNVKVNPDGSCGGVVVNLGLLNISNSTVIGSSVDGRGSGILNSIAGELHIANTSFSGNSADYSGGALYNQGNVTITSSVFGDNSADEWGGAIDNSGELTITSSDFTDNSSKLGGAIHNTGKLTITSSNFSGNKSTPGYGGGALYNADAGNLSIIDSSFIGNSASKGGAINNHRNGETSVKSSSFVGNSAREDGGAIRNSHNADISIVNSNFTRNSAEKGGGIGVFRGGEATLTHLSLVNNTAENGGGLYAEDVPVVKLRNSTIANNRGRDCFGSIDVNAANLDTDSSCFASLMGDPMLGEFVRNQRMALPHTTRC